MDASWKVAASATLHCLTGCAIGEVLGMVISTALGWGTVSSIALAVTLAFLFGYAFTMWSLRNQGIQLKSLIKLALASDTVSIAVMEITDNAFLLAVPGAIHAGLSTALFWWSLMLALAVAFVVAWPLNRWLIGRGRGHAVVHQYHHVGEHGDHHHEH